MSEYRIMKNTHRDLTVTFKIEKRSDIDYRNWNTITTRDFIADARYVIQQLKSQEIISSEVVE